MTQNKNPKKDDLESKVEKERLQKNKIIEKLKARILKLTSDRKKAIDCLTFVKRKLSSENISINSLISEIVKTLQEINHGRV